MPRPALTPPDPPPRADAELRVLFVSRKHPPAVGGMEGLSYHLVREVGRAPGVRARAVVWGHTQYLLPAFALRALLSSLRTCWRGTDVVHIGDPVLSWLGVLLKRLFRVPIVVTVHGLDLTFPMPAYQRLVPAWLRQYDEVISISRYARALSLDRGVPADRCITIPPGTDIPEQRRSRHQAREALAALVGRPLAEAKVLLTVGRLVPRKGVGFFVEQVLPGLVTADPSLLYLVVGAGPERERLQHAVEARGLRRHVWLAGRLPSEQLADAYFASDLFLAPNVPTPHDAEGFGLVVLEAAAHGCPALVADLEGLRDTVPAGSGAWFLEPAAAQEWTGKLRELLADPVKLREAGEMARSHVAAHCTWPTMGQRYLAEFRRLAG